VSGVTDMNIHQYLNLLSCILVSSGMHMTRNICESKPHMCGSMSQNRYLTPLGFIVNLVGEYITSGLQFYS
jgi:hypothetical protein